MSIVTVEFDNTLEKSDIVMPIMSSSKSEAGDDYQDNSQSEIAQTSVFGIQVPLIMINTTVIDFDSIHYFELKSNGPTPELIMTVEDRYELITNIDKPSHDNEVRIQIIPRFDNAYKKINLTFFINDIDVTGSMIKLTCLYKLPLLMSSQYKAFGEIDTYSLFKTIASEIKLGFATNVAALNDKRFVYCDNRSLHSLLDSEITFANATEHIMDWWIDFWDNVNLVDIKERYLAVDPDDDIKIWVAGETRENRKDGEIIPNEVVAVLNNHPSVNNSELFVKEYTIKNNPGQQAALGSDKVYGIYADVNNEYSDYLIQDGDIKNDIFAKYDYLGENYGEYNYLFAKCLRAGYLQKINSETIKVTLKSPLLGLMRGHRVNFIRYVNDDYLEGKMKSLEEAGVIDRNVESNIPLEEYELNDEETKDNKNDGKFRLDKTTSGQYLIIAVELLFTNNEWEYVLTLARPAPSNQSIKVEN
jgi:hypothetical protein